MRCAASRRVSASSILPSPPTRSSQGDSPLTERESDVLSTARTGGSIADIARILHLSEGTVRNHLSSAIGKTGGRNRADAARIAEENGWL